MRGDPRRLSTGQRHSSFSHQEFIAYFPWRHQTPFKSSRVFTPLFIQIVCQFRFNFKRHMLSYVWKCQPQPDDLIAYLIYLGAFMPACMLEGFLKAWCSGRPSKRWYNQCDKSTNDHPSWSMLNERSGEKKSERIACKNYFYFAKYRIEDRARINHCRIKRL